MLDDDYQMSKIRNQYAQLLRIQVRNRCLHGPFTKPPPDGALCSLAEHLGNLMAQQVGVAITRIREL